MAAPHPTNQKQTEGERLAKRVAALVPCSRREAEQTIEGGWVQVDGKVIEEPQFRVLNQRITIDPNASLLELNSITLLLHKPADWLDGTEESLATLNRQAGRSPHKDARTLLVAANHVARDPSGMKLLQRHFKQQSACVPLETGASGLVVFTQDWRVQRKLTEDLGLMENELMAEVRGEVSEQALRILNRDHDARGQSLPPAKVSINSSNPTSSKLRFAIRGAHLGLVAYRCEQAQLDLLALRRIRLGRVALSDLPEGQWRYLAANERF
jgi:23S rRNA pseudouridine2604 synthase